MSQDNVYQEEKLPFGLDFQKSLMRLLIEDDAFAHAVAPHLQPQFFANEIIGWAYHVAHNFREQYGGMPSLMVLKQEADKVDVRMRPAYQALVDQIGQASLRDEHYMRDKTIDFVKRNIFVRTHQEVRQLFNSGQVDKAYDLTMERINQIQNATWQPVDRGWLYDELPRRHMARLRGDLVDEAITTGLPWLDHILNGGLHIGELGIWIAEAKGGKSTMLVNHGVAATTLAMAPTAHFVFEGKRSQVEARYDSALMEEVYHKVKLGDISPQRYAQVWERYRQHKGLLVVRGFTEDWDYSIIHVHEELKVLEQQYGWKPKLIIIDYGDLIRGRAKTYPNETEKQKAAFRDQKSLANRGYAIWTASQAQRPKEGSEDKPHWIYSRMIADCYDKVRVGDFLGSINSTLKERNLKIARLLAELYRDNEANQSLVVRADFTKMLIREEPGLVSPDMPDTQTALPLGYQHQSVSI